MQSTVTCPSVSAVQVTPGVCVEQVSDGDSVDSMHAQLGVAAQAEGIETHE